MNPLRLVIFEDNGDFRESLLHLFACFTPDVEVMGAYPDCTELRRAMSQLKPEVVLMNMPGIDEIEEATAVVKEVSPNTQVVMLTVS